MKGEVYPNHGRGVAKLHRWFISYIDRMGHYTEENFDTRKEALARIRLAKSQKHLQEGPELWTRERAMSTERLRP